MRMIGDRGGSGSKSDGEEEGWKKFELPGSRAHYAPSLNFTISHMKLAIESDFEAKTISCEQRLEIAALEDTDTVELDAAELQIKSVSSDEGRLDFRTLDDRLTVKLGKMLQEGGRMGISISYSARPRKGFYFIAPDRHYPDKKAEAWTQGESTESKYWFPCIDHPQVKFSSEISVAVPAGMTAISNGRLVKVAGEQRAGRRQVYHWSEPNPHPAYLTSVVIGRYAEIREGGGSKSNGSNLYYYVPEDRRRDALRSFEHTADMVKFFEDYFGVRYPYDKYSQVTVQDFVYGGMENASCTTLTMDTLHDKKAHVDFTSDHLVSHELAHQWFGDLVTCRDWQHVWLNEGFATYCEALYWESSRGRDEFHYYAMQTADDYLEEAGSRYARPIVTKVYKHPDDLFDRHTYEKGACVLHMLHHRVGDRNFRRAVKTYLQRFANGTAETDDLRRVFELETGKSLQQFFDQWVYGEGHPELKIEFSQEGKAARIRVKQVQPSAQRRPFEFPLQVRFVFAGGRDVTHSFDVSERECSFQVPVGDGEAVEWFSVDPEFKILKRIVSVRAAKEMLTRQLQDGSTVVERVEAARALKGQSAEGVIDALQKAVMQDRFWGVAAEAAKTLGSIRTDYAYEALKKCISVRHPKARRAVVRALGEFKKEELVKLLSPLLGEGDESYFVESEAATAIGKSKDRRAIPVLRKALETATFQNVVAQGAVAGLKEFAGDSEVAGILVEKSRYGNHHRVRDAATFALGKFLDGSNSAAVSDHLKSLLSDRWFKVRISACRAFADADQVKAIADLSWVAENDLDHRVRRVAEECINMIRESTKKPREVSEMREELDRIKSKNLELMQKMDRLERGMR